jgi:phycoerythrin-associated linker protein
MVSTVFNPNSVKLSAERSAEQVKTVIRAVYRQVLGNPHVMESERLTIAESQLADGSLSVRGFVQAVGKSEFYRARYFEQCAPYRFVELNFMHFLGRPPQSQAEISEHIGRCVTEGYEAEIDSYIDSAEYQTAFGEDCVPDNRGAVTAAGQSQVTYNRMFALDRGASQISSAVKSSQLVYAVATNSTTKINRAATNLAGSGDASKKQFRILVQGSKSSHANRTNRKTYLVSGDNMTPQLKWVHQSSGKIVSITEVV